MQRVKNYYHLLRAIVANLSHGFPSKKLTVIGVTGSDGKTTTTSLIYHILNTAQKKVSMVSTVGAIINGTTYDVGFHVTNPAPSQLQKFIKKALVSGNDTEKKYMVIEATSHGIDQYRVWGIPFTIGVITNVSDEHLDYHKTYEKYVTTKAKLLLSSKQSIINKDDRSYSYISAFLTKKKYKGNILTYGLSDADITPELFPFKTTLLGNYNTYNVLAGISTCLQLGIEKETILSAIDSFQAPIGRAQIVYQKDFRVMIDFAHTSNSFEQILSSVRPQVKGRIIHVFGSAGKRDVAKRKVMGENSSKYADVIILTAEDPRSEDVNHIIDQIAQGISKKRKIEVLKIPDRTRAITTAIAMAKRNDMVICTGKAHEKSMNLGHGEESWDEFAVVKKALEQR